MTETEQRRPSEAPQQAGEDLNRSYVARRPGIVAESARFSRWLRSVYTDHLVDDDVEYAGWCDSRALDWQQREARGRELARAGWRP